MANIPTPSFALVGDLLSSKKFKALLALVILWTKPVHEAIGIDIEGLKWLTGAFAAYFVSQAFRDLGEELVTAVRVFIGKTPTKEAPKSDATP